MGDETSPIAPRSAVNMENVMEVNGKTKSKTTTMRLMKSTGNTYVYHEEGHDKIRQVFPTVYLQKHNFGASNSTPPDTIRVTVEWE
jgi:hypothetical protein